jgi:FkbH-like protein
MRSVLGLSKKLVVLDLDNTLWGGVIGEDGLGGIKLGPPSAMGEMYQGFQTYLKGLHERGIPLAVVSKNNHADAASVFEKHEACVLKPADFASFRANWQDKPANLRALADELKLGLDSFVFLDDNPAERAAVRAALPEVTVPEITGDPAESIAVLERGLYFQAVHFTAEDRKRSASYQAQKAAHALSERAGSVEEYLAELDTTVQVGVVDDTSLERVAQLVNKTNQFNLTSRRYTESELAERMKRPSAWFRWFRVRDRFADHGLTGVVLADLEDDSFRVDLWLMSCRVIGRGIEDLMFNSFLDAAKNAGTRKISARYVPTAKNALVSQLLPKYGFTATSAEGTYELRMDEAAVKPCTHLRQIPIALDNHVSC